MKKNYVKVALVCMLAAMSPMTFTSCGDDYDGDISRLDTATTDLNGQISTLKEALTQAESIAKAANDAAAKAMEQAKAAQQTGDKAEQDAAQAIALAKAAEAAAQTAKSEAIKEAIAECQKLIDQNSAATTEALSKLEGKINGIESGLATFKADTDKSISELQKAVTAVETQLKALKTYEEKLAEFNTKYTELSGDIAKINSSIKSLSEDLTAFKKQLADNKANIDEVKKNLEELSKKVSTEIENSVNTIAGVIGGRLTSVTLMPDLYIDGIPTIEFKSARYNRLAMNEAGVWVSTKDQLMVTNNNTTVEYRVSPSNVSDADIDMNNISFVSRVAESRAENNSVIKFVSGKVNDGVLTVKAGKNTTGSLLLDGKKINTVALNVPVAKKHLFEGESSFSVFSEYTRVSETYFQPSIEKTKEVAGYIDAHFNDSTSVYSAPDSYHNTEQALIAYNHVYNKPLDLNTLVQGCAIIPGRSEHEAMTLEELKEYGFEVRYFVATAPYSPWVSVGDNTNQQEFAKISGSTLTPVVKTANGYEANNQTAIGKEPIIHILLVDTNHNNVIASKYIKIRFTKEEMKPLTFTANNFTANLACGPYKFEVTEEMMISNVLSQFPNNGISKEEFANRYYTFGGWTTSVAVDGVVNNALRSNVYTTDSWPETTTAVSTFSLTNSEIGKLEQGKSKVYTITVTYKNSKGLYPDVNVVYNVTITNNLATPTLGKTDAIKWKNETMLLYPVPFKEGVTTTAEYNTNIFEGRNKPYINGLIKCALWSLNFDKTYTGASIDAVSNKTAVEAGATSSLNTVNVTIANDVNGIKLVESEAKLGLVWSAYLNGEAANNLEFANSTLQIVKPLKNPVLATGVEVADNSHAQNVELMPLFSLTDAYGNKVANTGVATDMAQKLWNYYVVETPVFAGTAGDIVVTDDTKGTNARTLASLNMVADVDVATNTLTFSNNGAPLQGDAYLQIPVKIAHKWGALEGKLYIKVKHVL